MVVPCLCRSVLRIWKLTCSTIPNLASTLVVCKYMQSNEGNCDLGCICPYKVLRFILPHSRLSILLFVGYTPRAKKCPKQITNFRLGYRHIWKLALRSNAFKIFRDCHMCLNRQGAMWSVHFMPMFNTWRILQMCISSPKATRLKFCREQCISSSADVHNALSPCKAPFPRRTFPPRRVL
jgi:hypothetical protein